jgi:hypothetical protein
MSKAHGTHRRPLHLDNPVEVPGGVIGSDPYRRWGPVVRWAIIVLETPLMGNVNWRPLNKRDVVIVDPSRTEEFYRQGPFSANDALTQQKAIVTTVKAVGLAEFLRQAQVKAATIGRVTKPGEMMGMALVRETVQDSQQSIRQWFGEHLVRRRDQPND